jgi:hypothetical protein
MPYRYLFIDGRRVALRGAETATLPNGVMSLTVDLSPSALARIVRAKTVGIGVMAKPTVPTFYGFDDMPAPPAAKLTGFLAVCRAHHP